MNEDTRGAAGRAHGAHISAKRKPPAGRTRKPASWWAATLATYAFLAAGAALTVAPFVFSVFTSLKSPEEFAGGDPLSPPSSPTVENYTSLFGGRANFVVPLAVTLQAVAVLTVGQMVCSVLAAYAFARLSFPGREFIFWTYVATLMVPAVVTMIPLFAALTQAGMKNTFAGLVVPFLLGSPYAIFLLRQNFQGVPSDVLDAAKLDGAGHWRTLWSIMLPMNRPILATLLLITVVSQWNSFMWPSIIAPEPTWHVFTVATQALQQEHSDEWTLVMAATVLALAPLIILYAVFHRQIVRSLGISGLR